MDSYITDMVFFCVKQKTTYEFLSGLVGSEMCLRDRSILAWPRPTVPRVMIYRQGLLLNVGCYTAAERPNAMPCAVIPVEGACF